MKTFTVFTKHLKVNARKPVKAFFVGPLDQPEEVLQTFMILGNDNQMVPALPLIRVKLNGLSLVLILNDKALLIISIDIRCFLCLLACAIGS